MPVPRHAIPRSGVGGRHAVLLVRLVERMAANPRLPATVRGALDDRILHAGGGIAAEDGHCFGVGQPGGVIGLEQVDPPVLARWLAGRADVEAPAPIIGPDDGGALHRGGIEAGAVDLGHGRQLHAVRRGGDDGEAALRVRVTYPVRDHEPATPVVRGARRAGPRAHPGRRGRGGHLGAAAARQRERAAAQRSLRTSSPGTGCLVSALAAPSGSDARNVSTTCPPPLRGRTPLPRPPPPRLPGSGRARAFLGRGR